MMKNILFFLSGAGISYFVTKELIKNEYRNYAVQEIEAVRKYYDEKNQKIEIITKQVEKDESVISNGEITNYSNIIKKENYTADKNSITNAAKEAIKTGEQFSKLSDKKNEDEDIVGPYLIKPEEMGKNEEYAIKSLTLHLDNYITDEVDNNVGNIDNLIGAENIKLMGTYEDDALHICDDENGIYYEILKVNTPHIIPLRGDK